MHVMLLAGWIDHGGECSILQSGRMIQYWAGRTRNRCDFSSSMLRGESITYDIMCSRKYVSWILHIKMKNACCKYSGLQHRLQHNFSKWTATTASEAPTARVCSVGMFKVTVKRCRRNTEAESTNSTTCSTLSRKLLLWQSLSLYTSTVVVVMHTKM